MHLNQGIYPVLKGCVNGCTTLIPKICFDNVGNFKEELKTTNDYDMWIRLFNEYPSYLIEERLIKYRIHKNQDTNKSPVYISESNELWKDIINSLTEEQIKNWGFDKFNIYMTLYIQMKNSKFMEAADLAYCKAKEIYKEKEPTITVAMPCYNSEKYLSKAMPALFIGFSKSFVLGPVVIQPDFKAAITSSISCSLISGGENGIFFIFFLLPYLYVPQALVLAFSSLWVCTPSA